MTLKLEAIGDDSAQLLRMFGRVERAAGVRGDGTLARGPWVAELTGTHPRFRFRRRFLDGQNDYSEANSIGSRGVFAYYHLEPGRVYEVNAPVTWKRTDRYFCRVTDGAVERLDELQVRRALAGLGEDWAEPDF